jgi:hypothetical protein
MRGLLLGEQSRTWEVITELHRGGNAEAFWAKAALQGADAAIVPSASLPQ